jgi:Zn-dependent protease with chaperone function
MDKVIKRLGELTLEKRVRQILLGDAVRLGPRQIPAVWQSQVHVSSVLDIAPPPLYITQMPLANAMAFGAKNPAVILYSGLITDYQADEIEAVLAHEAGHVLSEHVYYTTVLVLLQTLLGGALSSTPLAGLPVRGLYLLLLEWARAAELSSDRASALVCGDPMVTCRMLMRMAGGPVDGMNVDAFIQQATEYAQEDDLFARHMRFTAEMARTHPFAVRRVRELIEWVGTGEYDRLRAGAYVRRGNEPGPSAEFESAVRHYGDRFASVVERTVGGVSKLSGQIADWLHRDPAPGDGAVDDVD